VLYVTKNDYEAEFLTGNIKKQTKHKVAEKERMEKK
jgi:hypothetical protein